MTIDEFNSLGLSLNDKVKITMIDGTERFGVLYSGQAYLGRGNHENYLTKEKYDTKPPAIQVIRLNNEHPADHIPLENVSSVKKI